MAAFATLRRSAAGAALLWASCAHALSFTFTINDPTSSFGSYYGLIRQDLSAAGEDWGRHLAADRTVNMRIGFVDIPTADGRSTFAQTVRETTSFIIAAQGVGWQLSTNAPTSNQIDAEIRLGASYLPLLHFSAQGPLPPDRIDARSVLRHELGHVIGMNTYHDAQTYVLPRSGDGREFVTTFDEHMIFDGGRAYFTGLNATQAYGGRVPLTDGSIAHLGNRFGPGADLVDDLMNGVHTRFGRAYEISRLDVAIMCDVGLPMVGCIGSAQAPAPAPYALLTVAAVGAAIARRRTANPGLTARRR